MIKKIFLAGAAVLALSPSMAFAGDDVNKIVTDGKFYADFRYRYEHVDQDGFNNDAKASTLRTKVGFKTGLWNDFQALVELELSGNLNDEDYNDTVNSNTTYPVIADPNNGDLNQMWLSWGGLPDTTIKAGRQGINIDNQRFVGTVGWRQNDQTFDSAAIINNSIENLTLMYGFVWNVNRIFGDAHPMGDLETTSHILHADYKLADWMKATGYAYLLDVDMLPAVSSQTYGLRLTGDVPLNEDLTFFYTAEAAEQADYENNTTDYDATYFHVSPGVKWNGLTLQAGFESMEGDGTIAFSTPLATLHAHNGWADKFLNTPANGLEDAYAKVSYKVSGVHDLVDGAVLSAAYHDFDAENTGADYGDEWNFQVKTKSFDGIGIFKKWSVALKYADYDAEDLFTDTQKAWFTVSAKF